MTTVCDKEMETADIKKVFNQLFAAWDEGDASKFTQQFTDDIHYITFFGEHLKSKKEVEDSHHHLFNGVLKGSKMQGEVTEVRYLTEDIAIAYCVGNTKMKWQNSFPKKRQSINTNVLIKQNGEWKITSFHNCRIKEPNFIMKFLSKKLSK